MCDQLITGGGVPVSVWVSQTDAVLRTTVNSASYVGNVTVFAVTAEATVTVKISAQGSVKKIPLHFVVMAK